MLDHERPRNTVEEAMNSAPRAYRLSAHPVLAAAIVLALPLLAMQVTDQVVWSVGDFAIAGAHRNRIRG